MQVVLCADGTFLSKQRITQRIVELGIDAVSVSLDSADAVYDDTWPPPPNKCDGWQRVVDGVRTAGRARSRLRAAGGPVHRGHPSEPAGHRRHPSPCG
ncbi:MULTISPECIES: hypothetical protein [unclassified Nonomuraea]